MSASTRIMDSLSKRSRFLADNWSAILYWSLSCPTSKANWFTAKKTVNIRKLLLFCILKVNNTLLATCSEVFLGSTNLQIGSIRPCFSKYSTAWGFCETKSCRFFIPYTEEVINNSKSSELIIRCSSKFALRLSSCYSCTSLLLKSNTQEQRGCVSKLAPEDLDKFLENDRSFPLSLFWQNYL